jgi:hypothetical protein
MFEGLFQPRHLPITASLLLELLALVICAYLAVRSLLGIDRSLKAILAELQTQRRN